MNTTILFIAANLASAFMGWIVGRTSRDAAKVAATVPEQSENKDGISMRPFRWIVISFMVICALTAANGIYISVTQADQARENQRFAECTTDQVNKLIDALDARFKSSREATLQLDQVFTVIVAAYQNPTPEAAALVKDAIVKYAGLRKKAEDTLKKNPYPEPPRNACRK